MSSVPHSSPDQHIQSSSTILGSGPIWISLEDNLLYHMDPREMLQPRVGRAEL